MSLLTWKAGQYSSHSASAADGTELFIVSWKSTRSDPNYLMRCRLPGLGGEWKRDDLAELKRLADAILATWLSKVTGLPTADDEFEAREAAYAKITQGSALAPDLQMAVSEGFAAGWRARAQRGKGEAS